MTLRTTSTVLVPDCLRICSSTVASPLMLASVVASATPSSMRATSPTFTGWPSTCRRTSSAELLGALHAPARAHRDRLRPLVDAAAGNVGVLRLQRPRHVVDGQVVGAQLVGVHPDVDLPLAAADHQHLADAVGALEPAAQHLVGVLGDVADRLVGAHRHREDRLRVRVLLLDGRLRDGARQQRQDAVDAVAHLLRGHVGVLLEPERDDDLRDALGGVRAELVDAADGVDGFLDLVGDLALHLLGRGAGQARGHGDRREVHRRQAIDPELAEGERADDDQREDEDRREDRTADAELSEPLHGRTL